MQNQKGNIGVIVSFIIVIGLIGAVIFSLMNKPIKVDPLEGINNLNTKEVSPNTDQQNTTNTVKEEPVAQKEVMNPNSPRIRQKAKRK